jgi:uncharacterized membrane protein
MAIAITLLILPLTEIEPARGATLADVAALVIAMIISFFTPSGGIWALFLLFPAQFIAGRVIRRRTPDREGIR